MGLIKDIYSSAFYGALALSLEKVVSNFDGKKFMQAILPPHFVQLEWKERMQHTTQTLHLFMPQPFAQSAALLPALIDQLKKDGFKGHQLEFMFLPDYIANYGIDDFEHAVVALELVTQYISAEFAVRPFMLKYGQRMVDQMYKWSSHPNHHVRRFASEGSRPRLPWAMAIPALKKDPAPLLPLLENLKNDPHEYVRRSVANNLNDITKDHPAVVIDLAKKWKGISKETDAIIKHACRTLLKSGHPEILSFYGLGAEGLSISALQIETPQVKIGDHLVFNFNLANQDATSRYIRLEYILYYLKQNGTLAGKVFKISEKNYPAGEKIQISRKQSFKRITTRKFYTGVHRLSIVVNGKEMQAADFELLA